MNPHTRVIGDATSVAERFGSVNGILRPEKVLDVTCINTSGATLYMQVHDLFSNNIVTGNYSGGGAKTVSGLTAGDTYYYEGGANDGTMTNGSVTVPTTAAYSGTFVAAGTSVTLVGTAAALVTLVIRPLRVRNSAAAEGAVPMFSFPVQAGLGGTLGRSVDIAAVYCCWSSTQAIKTIAAASGEINIVLKA